MHHHSTEPGCFPSSAIWSRVDHTYTNPTALPLGQWHVMANGRIHSLNIISVSGSTVKSEYNGLPIEDAEWDGKVLKFIRHETRGIDLHQEYTGYLMQYLEPDPKWRIAGVFVGTETAPPPNGPHAGWYATRPRDS